MNNNTAFFRLAGWCAYLSAAMTVLGLVTFILFLSLMQSQGAGNSWGPINDLTSVIGALANIVILIAMYRLFRQTAPAVSLITTLISATAMTVVVSLQSLLILKVIEFATTAVAVPAAYGVFGAGLIVYARLASRAAVWSKRLIGLGILAGVGYILTIAGFLVGGPQNLVVYAGGLLTAICATAWAIGFGRMLLKQSG